MNHHQRAPLQKILRHYAIAGIHPAAQLIPMASQEEFETMCADVAQNGFLHAVHINSEGLLLDASTRVRVAWALELDPPIERIDPQDTLSYVLSENIVRRHLTVGQLAMIGEKIANCPNGGDRKSISAKNSPLISRERAAALIGSTPWS